MNDLNIPELLQMVRYDPQAFRPIYRHFHPRVFAYVAYRVGRKEDAEDIVAEVFMRVVNNLEHFEYRGEGSFSAWLFRIARNEINRFFRNSTDTVIDVPIDEMPDIQSNYISVDVQVQRKEEFARLRQVINRLSERRQEVVRLKFFGELRNKEIAAVLDLDERSVASHLSRALNDLRDVYYVISERE